MVKSRKEEAQKPWRLQKSGWKLVPRRQRRQGAMVQERRS